jgi:hypothetical protein
MQHSISGYLEKRSLVMNQTDRGIRYGTSLRSPHFQQRGMVLEPREGMTVVSRLVEEVTLDIRETGRRRMVERMPD